MSKTCRRANLEPKSLGGSCAGTVIVEIVTEPELRGEGNARAKRQGRKIIK